MDINTVFNNSIKMIEKNICNDINYEEIAKSMGYLCFIFNGYSLY